MLESKAALFISSPQGREKERQWGTSNILRENATKLYRSFLLIFHWQELSHTPNCKRVCGMQCPVARKPNPLPKVACTCRGSCLSKRTIRRIDSQESLGACVMMFKIRAEVHSHKTDHRMEVPFRLPLTQSQALGHHPLPSFPFLGCSWYSFNIDFNDVEKCRETPMVNINPELPCISGLW